MGRRPPRPCDLGLAACTTPPHASLPARALLERRRSTCGLSSSVEVVAMYNVPARSTATFSLFHPGATPVPLGSTASRLRRRTTEEVTHMRGILIGSVLIAGGLGSSLAMQGCSSPGSTSVGNADLTFELQGDG